MAIHKYIHERGLQCDKDVNSDQTVNMFCPILNKNCIGRKCAMAVKISHYSFDPYDILWVCGLLHTREVYDGEGNIIAREPKK